MSNGTTIQECHCCSYLNCRKTPIKTDCAKKKLFTRVMERFYDNCAAYNLRYIPYRTVTDRNTCVRSIIKDFWILFCFLATNFIVLLTILSRIAMHFGGLCMVTIDWIKQVIHSESNQKPTLCLLYSDVGTGNCMFDPSLPTNETPIANEYNVFRNCSSVCKPIYLSQ